MNVFIHIPRTAGQTLSQLVLQNYDQDRILFAGDSPAEVRRLSQVAEPWYDACMGHIPWGAFSKLRAPVNHVTVLRNPIARYVSEYFFHQRTEGSYHYERIRAGMSLSEWFGLGKFPGYEILDNTACRYLSGEFVWADVDRLIAARARESLCRMAAFGITEMLDESVLLIGKALKLPHIFVIPTNIKSEVGDQAIDIAPDHELIKFDLELYDFAVDLFQDRINRIGPLFKEAVAAYRETATELRSEFPNYSGQTRGYEQPPELISRLREIGLPEPVKALYVL